MAVQASILGIPDKLSAFRVYTKGAVDVLGVANVKLPTLENITETIKGAGIAGELEVPIKGQFKSMTLTLDFVAVLQSLIYLSRQTVQDFIIAGSVQEYRDKTGDYVDRAVKIFVRGLPKKVELGKMEAGNKMDASIEIEVIQMVVMVDVLPVLQVDKINYVCMVDGKDYLAEVRTNLLLV
jgi:uncharacterized protein